MQKTIALWIIVGCILTYTAFFVMQHYRVVTGLFVTKEYPVTNTEVWEPPNLDSK